MRESLKQEGTASPSPRGWVAEWEGCGLPVRVSAGPPAVRGGPARLGAISGGQAPPPAGRRAAGTAWRCARCRTPTPPPPSTSSPAPAAWASSASGKVRHTRHPRAPGRPPSGAGLHSTALLPADLHSRASTSRQPSPNLTTPPPLPWASTSPQTPPNCPGPVPPRRHPPTALGQNLHADHPRCPHPLPWASTSIKPPIAALGQRLLPSLTPRLPWASTSSQTALTVPLVPWASTSTQDPPPRLQPAGRCP